MTEPLTANVRIEASPEVVFPYFTDPLLLTEWLGHWASLQPTPGGKFALDFATAPVRGTYLVVEPPNRVVFTWGIAGNDELPPGSSTVSVTLRADGADTIVELVHQNLPGSRRADHLAGWLEKLATLATVAA